ncbi:CHAT domain-containing protein [Streptomyces sp. NPDC058691]|uniref:CHAT domain-containing protein n=1 Tax=Streptomyces sp. NPDC058691 TaxID=3346601 RepID=UPI00365DDC0B
MTEATIINVSTQGGTRGVRVYANEVHAGAAGTTGQDSVLSEIARRWPDWHDETSVPLGALLALTVALRATEAWSETQINSLTSRLVAHGTGRRPSSLDLTQITRRVLEHVRRRPSPLLLRPVLSAHRDELLISWLKQHGKTVDADTPWGPAAGLRVPAPHLAADRALTGLFSALQRAESGPPTAPSLGANQSGAPWCVQPGRQYPKAPDWMSHNLLFGGEDQGRRTLGAVPWWYATVTTPDERFVVQMPRDARAMEDLVSFALLQERFAAFTVTFPPPRRQRRERAMAPVSFTFTYDLAEPWDTAEFALAVRSGCARLDVLHLADEGPVPDVRRTLLLDVPEAELSASRQALDDALAVHKPARLTRLVPPLADTLAVFHRVERLRSRDLSETLDLLLPGRIPLRRRKVLRSLESLRVQRAELRYADRPVPARLRHQLWLASLEARTEGQLPAALVPDRFADKLAVLGGDDRAFVHILTSPEGPSVLWARTDAARTRTDLLSIPGFDLKRFAELTAQWVRSDYSEALRRLLDELLTPLTETVTAALRKEGVRGVVLCPSGLFSLLPLHAAPVPSLGPDVLLGDIFDVTYAPSLAALTALEHRPLLLSGGTAFFGHRADVNDLPALPREAQVLRHLYGDTLTSYTDGHAVPDELFRQGRTADVLHVSGHGEVHADAYANGIELASRLPGPDRKRGHEPDPYGGRLTLGRILKDGDFDTVRLAVLATCDSGTHTLSRPALPRVRTLDTALIARGVRAVVSTLWPLSDAVCPIFAAVLHAHLKDEAATPGEAFRAALGYLRDEGWERTPESAALCAAEDALSAADPKWRTRIRRFRAGEESEWPKQWTLWKASGVLW